MIGSVLLPTSPYRARSERLIRAAEAACARIHPLTDNVFPSLGETLVWLVAIDDLLSSADSKYRARRDADPDGAGLPGIRFARNAVVHGEMVTATTYAKPGAVLGAAPLGTFALGEGPSTRWVARASIAHTPKRTKYLSAQEQSYDVHVAGRDVLSPLSLALAFLRRCSVLAGARPFRGPSMCSSSSKPAAS
jgi:hypothetical protein